MSEYPPRECTCDQLAHPCEIHDCTGGETDQGPSSPDPDQAPEPASDPGEISDGYHTFRELYDHRHALWCAFASTFPPEIVWKSRQHDRPEVPMFDGYFIAGAELPSVGQVTYHLPDELWDSCPGRELERALPYDGHDSAEVVRRLRAYAMDVMIKDVW